MQGPPHRAALAALTVVLALSGCGGGGSLLTIDRVGRADAPKVLKLQINASYSPQAPTPSVAEGFKKLFTAATVAVEASGWGVLVWDPNAGRLQVMVAEKHQDLWISGATPLLVCDVWEHAYYLKYQNLRAKYVEAWWTKVNWADVSARFAKAKG